jgi:hypothetical protein
MNSLDRSRIRPVFANLMRCANGSGRLWLPWLISVFVFLAGYGAITAHAQGGNYLTEVGTPPFTTVVPVQLGFVDASNGDLHLEIPLGSYPQRHGPPSCREIGVRQPHLGAYFGRLALLVAFGGAKPQPVHELGWLAVSR